MNAKCWLACLLTVGVMTALAARSTPTREQRNPDPNDPTKTRKVISGQEREALGLRPHTWEGVVDREAYEALTRLNATVASLKEREKKGDMDAFQTRRRIRFPNMVYVEVHLKEKANQIRVLASLKASEFHAVHLFENHPGLIGFATKEALDKVAMHRDVVGVCLDDKPLPERGKPILKDDLPPAKPGEAADKPGVAEQKVDGDVYRAFGLADHVNVIVSLRGETIPAPTDVPSEMLAREEVREQEIRRIQNRALSAVTADEFRLQHRLRGLPTLSGLIDRSGLEKLWNHPDVARIYLQELRRTGVMRAQ